MDDQGEEWGPWIEHDGGPCPLAVGTVIEVYLEMNPGRFVTEMGRITNKAGLSWIWANWGRLASDGGRVARIIRYRVRKPRALRELIRMADEVYSPPEGPVRAPERPKVDA